MTDLQVRLLTRDGVGFSMPPLQLLPASYSFHAIGGPEQAHIAVHGSLTTLWEAMEWLRCPVEILDARGEVVWWGYVAAVEISVGAVQVGVSLDEMANKVAVAYGSIAPGSAAAGTRNTTDWASDADSVAEYGTKELLVTDPRGYTQTAENLRDRILAETRYPVPTVRVGQPGGEPSARLICRGWWRTLDWRYYVQANDADTVTTAQISTIISTIGQFSLTAEIQDASGLSENQSRDGDRTGLAEVMSLLAKGISTDKRLLAKVELDRTVLVYAEPASGSAAYWLDAEGRIYSQYNILVEPHRCPVAFWCRLRDVIPDTADLSKLVQPSPFFVERSEYDVKSGRLTLEPRGRRSVWEIAEIEQG